MAVILVIVLVGAVGVGVYQLAGVKVDRTMREFEEWERGRFGPDE